MSDEESLLGVCLEPPKHATRHHKTSTIVAGFDWKLTNNKLTNGELLLVRVTMKRTVILKQILEKNIYRRKYFD